MEVNKKWHVIYSKPRWEKKVTRLLCEQGIDTYCPLNRVRKKWSDRFKKVEVPLFTSYVFVNIRENEKRLVRETPGVLNFVYNQGKPAIIKNWEIDRIKKFLCEYEDVQLELNNIQKNQKVIVGRGIFLEKEGRVIDFYNKKVKIVIESLGYSLIAFFEKSQLESQ